MKRATTARRRTPGVRVGSVRLAVFDFDGVFTDNRVLVFQDGREAVWCSRADGLGLQALARRGIDALVLSAEKNPIVTVRCEKLGVRCIQGCERKAETLRAEAERLGVPLSDAAYLGNDVNDVDCLIMVGVPVCVRDSHPDALRAAAWVTERRGGEGAVRELCDWLLASHRVAMDVPA
ncbi:MAG: KdsC family phosphatase [Nitrospirota bacterium]